MSERMNDDSINVSLDLNSKEDYDSKGSPRVMSNKKPIKSSRILSNAVNKLT